MSGWECPKCHKVYAPFVRECESCNKVTTVVAAPSYPAPVYVPYWNPEPWWRQTWCNTGNVTLTSTTTPPTVTDA